MVSVTRADDGRRQRVRKIINEEREKYRAKNGSLRNILTDSKGAAFVKNHTSAPVRKERLSPTSKEASRNKFVEKGRMPDESKDDEIDIDFSNKQACRLVFYTIPFLC